jgi:hypothetical protein
VDSNPNGAGTVLSSDPALLPCPFSGLPQETHDYLHKLEARVQHLESEQKRFTDALVNAGQFIFNNPASKMMLAAFPKEVQAKLKEFFNGRV